MIGAVANGITPALVRNASIIATVSGANGQEMALPVLAWSSDRLMPLPSALGWKLFHGTEMMSPSRRLVS